MKLIILDRDGVINQDSDNYIKTVDEWIPLPGSLEAISKLNHHGYKVAVATNQSGISRGYYTEEILHQMHEKMKSLLKSLDGWVDAIFYCPHGPNDGCACRKPAPGLYHQIAAHFNTTLNDIPVIGDSYRDLEAAMSVGAKPVLVKTGKGNKTLDEYEYAIKSNQIPVYPDLSAAIDDLIMEKP